MATATVEKKTIVGEPKPRPQCSLRAKIVDELWRKYEPGFKPPPPAPELLPQGVVSMSSAGVTIRRRGA